MEREGVKTDGRNSHYILGIYKWYRGKKSRPVSKFHPRETAVFPLNQRLSPHIAKGPEVFTSADATQPSQSTTLS